MTDKEKLEAIEQALSYLARCREVAFTRSNNTHTTSEAYYNGQYAAYHKTIEVIKRAMEGKGYGK